LEWVQRPETSPNTVATSRYLASRTRHGSVPGPGGRGPAGTHPRGGGYPPPGGPTLKRSLFGALSYIEDHLCIQLCVIALLDARKRDLNIFPISQTSTVSKTWGKTVIRHNALNCTFAGGLLLVWFKLQDFENRSNTNSCEQGGGRNCCESPHWRIWKDGNFLVGPGTTQTEQGARLFEHSSVGRHCSVIWRQWGLGTID